ncbi:MAG TPA: FlgD immunoglobulin-like domain containing protein [Candidatus Kryptonia bacterium]
MREMRVLLLLAITTLYFQSSFAGNPDGRKSKPMPLKVNGVPASTVLNFNNLTSWTTDNALFPPNISNGKWNGEFPKGSGIGLIFQEGIVFGGMVRDGGSEILRVGGATYPTGMQAGRIITNGSGIVTGADDTAGANARIWRVRPDVVPGQASPPDLTSDAASYFQVSTSEVTAAELDQIKQQYYTDWLQWPASIGAPWYIDSVGVVRNDNAFDPTSPHCIPGVPGAGQTVWYVCNDLDPNQAVALYGSEPIGIEEQVTLWAYDSPAELNSMTFKQVKLIYKGTTTSASNSEIDSMYIVQWRDPDNGDMSDDYSGCDSTLNLGFCYNGEPVDSKYASVGLSPPASGVCVLEGPAQYTGNSSDSVQINFRWRRGYKPWHSNPMTGYDYFGVGSTIGDPDLGFYPGTMQMFNLMRGDLPRPQYPAGVPFYTSSPYATAHAIVTNFILSGDPVTHTGWVDGYDLTPGDRRDLCISGPFTLKLHDTAEVVVASIGAIGPSYLSSVAVLKQGAIVARNFYNSLFKAPPPNANVSVAYGASSSRLTIVANGSTGALKSMTASLRHRDGSLLITVPLYDDGQHGDGTASDGVFADTVTIPSQFDGLRLDISGTGAFGSGIWQDVFDHITTNGPLILSGVTIEQDNLNQDGLANPGEVLRLGMKMENAGIYPVNDLKLQLQNEMNGKLITVNQISSDSSFTMNYAPDSANSFFSLQIPASYSAPDYEVVLTVADTAGNSWQDSLQLPVYQFESPLRVAVVQHVSGKADGDFTLRIVRPDSVKDHSYLILGVDSIDAQGDPGISLQDSTTGTFLFRNHPLPDRLGDNMPLTDGFIVAGTTVNSAIGMSGWEVPSGVRNITWLNATGMNLEGFNGAIGMGYQNWFSSSTVLPSQLHNVLLKFVSTDTNGNPFNPSDSNVTMAYRYLRHADLGSADPSFTPFIINQNPGYAYQDRRPIPIAAYDEENSNQRLELGFLENNVLGGLVDAKYWPPLYSNGINNVTTTREWLFVFASHYSKLTNNPALATDILDNTMPLMWVSTANREVAAFDSTEEFEILARHYLTSADRWTFNPTVLGIKVDPNFPTKFDLSQNYPNPFNPQTAIRFSIPKSGHVTLKIYNILGQEIATIVNQQFQPGTYTYYWDGKNKYNVQVASGVYLYRIESSSGFASTRKMVLVK